MTGTPLPAPGNVLDGADMRVQELIHGHRFIQEQEPFMVVLETLAVCVAKPLGTVAASADTHEAFHYDLRHRRKMRFLLFQDRHLEKVVKDETIHDHSKWSTWKERVNDQFDPERDGQDHFAYLDNAFDCRLDVLLQTVRLLQSMEVDVMHNRRWTSRFLAVTGPDMVCTDMRESASRSWSADRRFFGRGGELVYLMLNRSSLAKVVGELLEQRLLNADDSMNALAKALTDPNDLRVTNTHIGYLPYRDHPVYERLAQDWKTILGLRLPNGHLFEPLFRMTGLNLVVYLAERAREELGSQKAEPIVADFTDGLDKQLRQSSKEHLNRHRQAANRAVRAFVEGRVKGDEAWQTAVRLQDPGAAAKVLKMLFGLQQRQGGRPPVPEEQLEDLIDQALARDKNNIHKYLLPLTKDIGLAKARPGIGAWFAVDDALIFALVMANVDRTVELRDFVARLFDRYSLVIGPQEARRAFSSLPVGVRSFEANLAAFEARMTRLGLTRRLSDDCAFVLNPFSQDHE